MFTQSSRWRDTTPYLWYCAVVFAWGNVLFGLDTGSFGSIQSLPSFLHDFGVQQDDGSFELPSTQKALMNSIVWPGKLLGTLTFEPLLERVGYKRAIYVCCVCQAIAVTIEITSNDWVQFSIGRILAYFTVGIIENAVPSYQAEIVPQALRGFFTGSLMSITTLGNMWGTGMGRFVAGSDTWTWHLAVGMQYVPAAILAVTVPFTIESPRWLIQHGRKDMALSHMRSIRPGRMNEDGTTDGEVNTIAVALKSSGATKDDDGTWAELFRGTHLPRTVIAASLFWFQQTAGGQFVNSYAPTFLQQIGLGTEAFTYTFLTQVVGFIASASVLFVVDTYGRRPVLLVGLVLVTLFNYLIAAFGTKEEPTATETSLVVASLVLLGTSVKFSVSSLAYLVGAEIGGTKMRKKTMGFATAVDVLSACVITFTLPYLLGEPFHLEAGVGWIMGTDALVGLVFSYLCVPELKGRSLEEVDEMFDGVSGGKKSMAASWQLGRLRTTGKARRGGGGGGSGGGGDEEEAEYMLLQENNN